MSAFYIFYLILFFGGIRPLTFDDKKHNMGKAVLQTHLASTGALKKNRLFMTLFILMLCVQPFLSRGNGKHVNV